MADQVRKSRRHWHRYTFMTAGALILGGVIVTQSMRQADRRDRERVWASLGARAQRAHARFDPAMVRDLSEPARRYFLRAIAPGTPLKTVAIITMGGRFGLGDRKKHDFYPMEAQQIMLRPMASCGWPRSAPAPCEWMVPTLCSMVRPGPASGWRALRR